jgi:uncharacterized protein
MRRKHAEVTNPGAIADVLERSAIGRLATTGSDGYPYVTPVNFVYHNGSIYFHSAPMGEKLSNIARDPHVCFEVNIPLAYLDSGFDPDRRACKLHQLFHCVIIRGNASIIPDGPEKTEALNALARKLEPGVELVWASEEMPAYKGIAVVRVEPATLTAKSDLVQNKAADERLALARYFKNRNRPGDAETVTAMGFDPAGL